MAEIPVSYEEQGAAVLKKLQADEKILLIFI
jgi:hypothetical protein